MNDKELIRELYLRMYEAMIAKDEKVLNEIHADDFTLIHMTGMRQDKKSYIAAIMKGTLNYYDQKCEKLDIQIDNDRGVLTGKSLVTAAVFGGGIHTWRLQLRFDLIKKNDQWLLSKAQASTY